MSIRDEIGVLYSLEKIAIEALGVSAWDSACPVRYWECPQCLKVVPLATDSDYVYCRTCGSSWSNYPQMREITAEEAADQYRLVIVPWTPQKTRGCS